jgi:hypothetical protein
MPAILRQRSCDKYIVDAVYNNPCPVGEKLCVGHNRVNNLFRISRMNKNWGFLFFTVNNNNFTYTVNVNNGYHLV